MSFGCASPDCSGSLKCNTDFLLLMVINMMHPYMLPKAIVNVEVKPVEVKHDVKLDDVNGDV